jgi:lipopolysaccharide transport system permease protein
MSAQSETIFEIKANSGRLRLGWAELWQYRELLLMLIWREIQVRYKQTAIGVLWVVLQPVLTTAIFTFVFTRFASFDSIVAPYPVFALSGLVIWMFFNSAVFISSVSLVVNSNLVTKVYFPRLILPFSAALSCLVDFVIALAVLAVFVVYYGAPVSWQIIFAPVFILAVIFLALGVGSLLASLSVRFRDVKHAVNFLLQVWMFSSPVFYPSNIFSGKWQTLYALNPLTGIIEGFRASIFGGEFNWASIGVSFLVTAVIFLFSIFVFRQVEDDFADVI